ncbi:MAG: TolC family protein [Marinifilaceae bacterium]|jgi:NodT family efflux transporter outer membrane factor (OMF) lipoprotein|nr:TolC family protein [Marinifilaceae bacterium]
MIKYYINNKLKILAASILVISASSCSSYKNLEKAPDIEIKTERLEQSSDTVSIAQNKWDDYFQDQKLKYLIKEALDNNIDMKIAVERVKKAESSALMAKLNKYPSLSAGLESNITIADNNIENYQLGFKTSWEADLWGKLKNQSRAKYANLLSTYEYQNLIKTQIISSIANSYYTLISLDKQFAVTQETVALLAENAETMKALKEAGQQNAAGVSQSLALFYDTKTRLEDIKKQIREQENLICILLGKEIGKLDRSSFETLTEKEELNIGIPTIAIASRPDIKQAQLAVQMSFANVKAAKANLYPTLRISSASVGNVATEFSEIFSFDNIAANIIGGLTQPIFNRGQIKANIKIEEANKQEAILNFRLAVLQAVEEVSNILYGMEISNNKKDYRKKQIDELKKSVEYTKELLIAGEAIYTEVLTSQRNLLSAQISQINEKLERLIYEVNLYKAIGGGVK